MLWTGVVPSLAFFLSGAAALIYETTWTRYLGLFLGHSAYAQALVLVTFLGGMGMGAFAAGRRSEERRSPWLLYAAVELVVGLLGFAFHPLYTGITGWAYEHLFPMLPQGALLIVVRWLIAAALILPPSVLLGATFPLLSVGTVRRTPQRPGRVLAALYFANSIGGAAGVLVGGFWLVGAVGLHGTLVAAGITNLLAACLVGGAELAAPGGGPATQEAASGIRDLHVPSPALLRRLLLGVAFGTAVASLIYEVVWTAAVARAGKRDALLRADTSAFLLGLSLGALWVRRRADRFPTAARARRDSVVMGGLAVATLPLYLASFHWTVALMAALDLTPQGYVLYTVARYAMCLAVMLPATFCAGMTLPLITRALIGTREGERAVGLVYGVNTLGSILGVGLAALILLPLIGLKALLFAGAALDMALGVWVLAAGNPRPSRRRSSTFVAAGGAVLLLAGVGWLARFDRTLLTSGVFGARGRAAPGAQRVIFYRDGLTATVSATLRQSGMIMLATNGKIDASLDRRWLVPPPPGSQKRVLSRDGATQTLLALITLAHVRRPRTAAVIGQGSGMSSHLLLGDPRFSSVTTIEIEQAMIAGSNAFYPANRRVFEDPRSHFAIDDARAYLAAGAGSYDLILSEPSNPWVSGVSGLFTTEFYAQVSRHLSEDGVFGQWLHLYEMNDDLLLSVLAALHRNFGSYALYYTSSSDVLVVASRRPAHPAPDWSVMRQPAIAADLVSFIPLTPQTLDALRFADRNTLAPLLAAGVPPNSDYFPVLDLGAERERYFAHTAQGFVMLNLTRFDPFAALAGRRTPLPLEPVTALPEVSAARTAAVAAHLRAGRDAAQDSLPRDADFRAALFRKRMLETFLAAGARPPDWQLFIRNVAVVEQDVHGPAQGVADETFYAPLYRYLAKAHAPAPAVAAVDFMHGLAVWDFPVAARAADRLLHDATIGEGWVSRETYRDGAVIAKLAVGDVSGARRLFDGLAPALAEGETLRERLLEAHLRAAEAAHRH